MLGYFIMVVLVHNILLLLLTGMKEAYSVSCIPDLNMPNQFYSFFPASPDHAFSVKNVR